MSCYSKDIINIIKTAFRMGVKAYKPHSNYMVKVACPKYINKCYDLIKMTKSPVRVEDKELK